VVFMPNCRRKKLYKEPRQHCRARGYYIFTVGRDETVIREYIQKQVQDDTRLEQYNLWRWLDTVRWPRTAEPRQRTCTAALGASKPIAPALPGDAYICLRAAANPMTWKSTTEILGTNTIRLLPKQSVGRSQRPCSNSRLLLFSTRPSSASPSASRT